MRREVVHCDACGMFASKESEPINGKDYCKSCLKNLGLEVSA